MTEIPVEHPEKLAASFTKLGNVVVALSNVFVGLAGLGIIFMMLATVYDVIVRYFFTAPTSWATETSTYALIVTIFLGAAYTHLSEGNVRVSVLLARFSPSGARSLELITAWLGFLFAAIAGWQGFLMVISDYENGSRLFSLLLTPSWMPKVPIALGFGLLAVAVLAEVDRLLNGAPHWRRVAPYAIAVAMLVVLVLLGRHPPLLPGTRFDFGSVAVLGAAIIGALLSGGLRVGISVLAISAASIALFVYGKSVGPGFLTTIIFIGIVFYIAIGVRIAFALSLVGLLSIYFLTPVPFPLTVPDRAWTGVNSFLLTSVPLYILMGALLVRSGLSNELFSVMAKMLARLPGGLAHAATAGCAIFSAVSGSSVATAATIGTVACPEMIKRGYSERLTYGTVAAGGTLGTLIPPSVPMIIYGAAVGVPIVDLLIAGIGPGIVMMLLFMAVIFIWAVIYPDAAPALSKGSDIPLTLQTAIDSGSVIALIVLVIASLYSGFATATETGALGAFLSYVICRGRGRLDRRATVDSILETVVVTSFIFLIVVGANIITFGFDYLKISQKVMAIATSAEVSRWVIFLIIIVVYVVLGAFLDSISMMVLTLPVVFPVIQALGFDPIWFGVILVIMTEVGLIHPPLGMNLFVLQGIGKNVSMNTIAMGSLPFLASMFVTVIILCVWPQIALFLIQ